MFKLNKNPLSKCKLNHTPNKGVDEYTRIQIEVIRRNAFKDFAPQSENFDINFLLNTCSNSIDYAYDVDDIESIANKLAKIRINDVR